jgi:hypothetical protein
VSTPRFIPQDHPPISYDIDLWFDFNLFEQKDVFLNYVQFIQQMKNCKTEQVNSIISFYSKIIIQELSEEKIAICQRDFEHQYFPHCVTCRKVI